MCLVGVRICKGSYLLDFIWHQYICHAVCARVWKCLLASWFVSLPASWHCFAFWHFLRPYMRCRDANANVVFLCRDYLCVYIYVHVHTNSRTSFPVELHTYTSSCTLCAGAHNMYMWDGLTFLRLQRFSSLFFRKNMLISTYIRNTWCIRTHADLSSCTAVCKLWSRTLFRNRISVTSSERVCVCMSVCISMYVISTRASLMFPCTHMRGNLLKCHQRTEYMDVITWK